MFFVSKLDIKLWKHNPQNGYTTIHEINTYFIGPDARALLQKKKKIEFFTHVLVAVQMSSTDDIIGQSIWNCVCVNNYINNNNPQLKWCNYRAINRGLNKYLTPRGIGVYS